jgi:hypothetical protein
MRQAWEVAGSGRQAAGIFIKKKKFDLVQFKFSHVAEASAEASAEPY